MSYRLPPVSLPDLSLVWGVSVNKPLVSEAYFPAAMFKRSKTLHVCIQAVQRFQMQAVVFWLDPFLCGRISSWVFLSHLCFRGSGGCTSWWWLCHDFESGWEPVLAFTAACEITSSWPTGEWKKRLSLPHGLTCRDHIADCTKNVRNNAANTFKMTWTWKSRNHSWKDDESSTLQLYKVSLLGFYTINLVLDIFLTSVLQGEHLWKQKHCR